MPIFRLRGTFSQNERGALFGEHMDGNPMTRGIVGNTPRQALTGDLRAEI
jgi:hypothetical protein